MQPIRRIVHIVRAARRLPVPGMPERAFLEELAAHGVVTGAYNQPDWEETPEGFSALLERLIADHVEVRSLDSMPMSATAVLAGSIQTAGVPSRWCGQRLLGGGRWLLPRFRRSKAKPSVKRG
ncbi:MAG: hypothetical protein K9N23_09920 [Akkermansiaceae bacterium]|nr:hypothetical protein [Akkermansiaceae bacterium]MCF7731996.1 hypothetical protein [Akkermansiaceae bacterium]